MSLLWKLWRCREGGRPRYAHVDEVDDDALAGALAAAEEEFGVQDPADLASVIDWPSLMRKGETREQHAGRTGA